MKVTYLSEDPHPQYKKKLMKCKDFTDVSVLVMEYKDIFPESINNINIDNFCFNEFKKIRSQMKSNNFDKNLLKKYGEILLPTRGIQAFFLAKHFCAPWGTAYIRLKKEVWDKELGL